MDTNIGMTQKSGRRKRGQNFSAAEKDCLLNAVFSHKQVIENKKTDAVTWKQKEEAWIEVGKLFNCRAPSGIHRDVHSLKKLYENMKKEQRKMAAHNKSEIKKTGGGSGDFKTNPHEALLLSIINRKTVYGLANKFDSDAANNPDVDHSQEKLPEIDDTIIFDVEGVTSGNHNEEIPTQTLEAEPNVTNTQQNDSSLDWGDFNVNMLRTPINKKLTDKVGNTNSNWTARRRPIATSLPSTHLAKEYSDVAKLKKEIAEYTLQAMKEDRLEKKEEHKLRMLDLWPFAPLAPKSSS